VIVCGRTQTTRLLAGGTQSKASGCAFCNVSGHNVSTCPKKLPFGKHLTGAQLVSLVDQFHSETLITPVPPRYTSNLPFQSLPKQSQYMVVLGHHRDNSIAALNPLDTQFIRVTMIDKSGKVSQEVENKLVRMQVVLDWISKKQGSGGSAKKGRAFSKVFSMLEQSQPVPFSSVTGGAIADPPASLFANI